MSLSYVNLLARIYQTNKGLLISKFQSRVFIERVILLTMLVSHDISK